MTHTEIRNTLQEIAREELDWSQDLPQGSLSEELDSMQKMSLVVGIEDRFLICFEPEEEEQIDTVDILIDFISKKIKERSAS